MPTRADIEYATPPCHRRRVKRDGQHGVHFTCFQPMRHDAATNWWLCSCGGKEAGELVAARRWEMAA